MEMHLCKLCRAVRTAMRAMYCSGTPRKAERRIPGPYIEDLPLERLAYFERELDAALTAAGITIPIDRALSSQLQPTLEKLARTTSPARCSRQGA